MRALSKMFILQRLVAILLSRPEVDRTTAQSWCSAPPPLLHIATLISKFVCLGIVCLEAACGLIPSLSLTEEVAAEDAAAPPAEAVSAVAPAEDAGTAGATTAVAKGHNGHCVREVCH